MTLNRFNSILLCLHNVETANLTPEERIQHNNDDPFWIFTDFEDLLSKHCYTILGQINFFHWMNHVSLLLEDI